MIIFSLTVIVTQLDSPQEERRTRSRGTRSPESNQKEIYYPLFPLNRHPIGNINCYRIVYTRTTPETAIHYARFFDMPDEYTAEEESYSFANEKGRLFVYRHAQQLTYIPAKPLTTEVEAFFETRGLPLVYEETRLGFVDGAYTVTYVDYMDNLRNFDYFFVEYEKLGSTRIMSMYEAYGKLPQESEITVTLTNCQLVYYYENSVVQPAYFFEGETEDEETVEYFVKAALYKN
jgi:hypothetical protein